MNSLTHAPKEVVEFLLRCGVAGERLERIETLERLYDDLVEANRRDNLTRLTTPEEYWVRHVADSLAIGLALPEVLQSQLRIADVGCGAGFPLLTLAWANPKLTTMGLEPKRKKAAFIAEEVVRMQLSNCDVDAVQAREAAQAQTHHRRYDIVTLRAVGEAGRLIRACRNLLSETSGSRLVCYKTPEAVENELNEAEREAGKFDLQIEISEMFTLPLDSGARQFLMLRRP